MRSNLILSVCAATILLATSSTQAGLITKAVKAGVVAVATGAAAKAYAAKKQAAAASAPEAPASALKASKDTPTKPGLLGTRPSSKKEAPCAEAAASGTLAKYRCMWDSSAKSAQDSSPK
jgi:hypothetical protein